MMLEVDCRLRFQLVRLFRVHYRARKEKGGKVESKGKLLERALS